MKSEYFIQRIVCLLAVAVLATLCCLSALAQSPHVVWPDDPQPAAASPSAAPESALARVERGVGDIVTVLLGGAALIIFINVVLLVVKAARWAFPKMQKIYARAVLLRTSAKKPVQDGL